jgi:uncharacterized protein
LAPSGLDYSAARDLHSCVRLVEGAFKSPGNNGNPRTWPQQKDATMMAHLNDPPERRRMLWVVHAIDKKDALATRAKFYRDHRIHLDRAEAYEVAVVTAGTLVADDGETPVGSIFVIDAKNRATVDAFTRSDPYCVNKVWESVQVHGYNKKRGTPIVSLRNA